MDYEIKKRRLKLEKEYEELRSKFNLIKDQLTEVKKEYFKARQLDFKINGSENISQIAALEKMVDKERDLEDKIKKLTLWAVRKGYKPEILDKFLEGGVE